MRGRALAVLMSTYYGVLGLAMAAGGLLVDGAGARVAWAAAGAVYLVSTVLAFVLAGPPRQARLAAAPEPSGLARIGALMAEIDETRRLEESVRADVALAPPEGQLASGIPQTRNPAA
jgi:hypothetical protein